MRHQLFFGLGELQVMEHIILKKKGSFKVRRVILAPTGKTNGLGQPDYQVFKEVS
jgi:hypothetical protein